MAHYRIKTPNGLERHFVKIDGDDTAEREVVDYWFEGCTVELWEESNMFTPRKIRDVSVEDLKTRLN